MRVWLSRASAVVAVLSVLLLMGCALLKASARPVAEQCSEGGAQLGADVGQAIHSGGVPFEALVSLLVDGIKEAACIARVVEEVKQHLDAAHSCANATPSPSCAVPIDAAENRRAMLVLKLARAR